MVIEAIHFAPPEPVIAYSQAEKERLEKLGNGVRVVVPPGEEFAITHLNKTVTREAIVAKQSGSGEVLGITDEYIPSRGLHSAPETHHSKRSLAKLNSQTRPPYYFHGRLASNGRVLLVSDLVIFTDKEYPKKQLKTNK